MPTKKQLRHHMLRWRQSLDPAFCETAACQVQALLAKEPVITHSRTLAAYYALKQELNLTPTITACWQRHQKVFLPCLDGTHLAFREYTANSTLHPNSFQCLEPSGHSVPPETIDIFLLPLLAFDTQGYRLGWGQGFYDRTLKNNLTSLRLGVGYAEQQVTQIPHDPWDIPLHGIVTEKCLTWF